MEHPNCICIPNLPDDLYVSNIEPTCQDELEKESFVATVTFEPTPVGKTAKKTFKVQNQSEVSHTYNIEMACNKIFRYFECKLAIPVVKSGQYLQCTVFYSPQVINEKNVEYMKLVDEENKTSNVFLEGESLGANVMPSIKRLLFYKTKNMENLIQNLEFRNPSTVGTFFQIDLNKEAEPLFTVDKMRGRLEPRQYVFIKVKFVGTRNGVFYQPLTCLLTNHCPIIVDLVAVKTAKHCDCFLKTPPIKHFPMNPEDAEGYSGYMYDSLKTTTSKPPFSLSTNFLNFGLVELKNSHTMITCLTNHLRNSVTVIWENDQAPPFSINPKDITIPGGESVLYEVQYKPIGADQLNLGIFRGLVYWYRMNSETSYAEGIKVPLSVSVRVYGHSFPKNKEWLPRIQVQPSTIILPPTVPNIPTYTTFVLKNFGKLPTSFTFLPPEKTNFLLKPMVGIVYDYQIVVVQLQPDHSNKRPYVEKWTFELNGRTDESFKLFLKGASEQPRLIVGKNNLVAFTPVFPGCQDTSTVMICNPSIHCLEYQFELTDNLKIDYPKGRLASNEVAFMRWHCAGQLKAPEIQTILCKLRNVQQSEIVTGFTRDLPITFHTKSCYSELCAFPKQGDFGYICFGDTKATTFQLFNFGESSVHFKLHPICEPNTDALTITPSIGTVYPKQKVPVRLEVKANKNENVDIRITYYVRISESSEVLVEGIYAREVFHLKFFGKYPTLQIEDILSHNFGFLFSKITLWDLLNIDRINKIFQDIQHDETMNVEMYLPDFEMGPSDFNTILIVRNVTEFDTDMKIERLKNCDCKPVGRSLGMSLRGKSDDCIHKDIFKFTLSDNLVMANLTQLLKFDVKYLEHGLSKSLYKFTLSENRIVNFFVNITALPEIVRKPSTYTRQLELALKDVFVGEKEPAAQVLPLYNNSDFVVNYEIDSTPLKRLNFDYHFEILKCINAQGTLQPFTNQNILFVFTPIEARKYNVQVPVRMGEESLVLKIHGQGVPLYVSPSTAIGNKMPLSSKGSIENQIELSVDHLIIDPFPAWGRVQKLIFIKNQTHNRIIGYSWLPCAVGGIVKVDVVYPKGILQPRQTQPIIVRIHAYDQPCQLRLQLVCKLLDHTQYSIYKESLVAYTNKQDDLRGQFVITERGMTYPVNDVVIQPRPETFFTTLSLDISITSSSDRDLHVNFKQQMEQAPQYSLRIHMQKIVDQYCGTVNLEEKSEFQKGDGKKENAKLFKTVSECILADVLFSNLFCNSLKVTSEVPLPFYNQFNVKDDSFTKSEDKNEQQQITIKRLQLANDFLNKPQAPLLASALKEVIADSLHELFKLGPQGRHVLHTSHHQSTKRNFVCSICKCNS